MGHDLTRELWSPLAKDIIRHGDGTAPGLATVDRAQPAS